MTHEADEVFAAGLRAKVDVQAPAPYSGAMEDGYALPVTIGPPEPPPLEVPPHHVALDSRGPDPLDCGFTIAGGVLAPLPAKVRLPHEDDEAAL